MTVADSVLDLEAQDMGSGEKKRPGPGRPPGGKPGKQVGIRLPESMIADLEYIADAYDRDFSSAVREILGRHIPAHLIEAREHRAEKEAARKAREEDGDE